MSMYQVPIYRVSFEDDDLGKLYEVDHIVVKETYEGTVEEIITGYDDIDLLRENQIHDDVLEKASLNYGSYIASGYQLVVKEKDIQEKNQISCSYDLERYLDRFEHSRFSDLHARICGNYFQYSRDDR